MAEQNPVTRKERILAAMAGNADALDNLNEPIRREERLLYKILQSGGGGGSGGGADLEWRVAQTLPSTGQSGVIYLVPNSGSDPNIYDEYVWIDSESRFEVIGSTQIDLSDYVQTATNTSVDGGLASFSGTDGHTLKKAATVGTATKGVYIGSDGVPAAMTYSLETDVPSGAFDPATSSAKGVVKIGSNIDVAGDGTISVKDGSKTDKGVLKVGENLSVTDATITVPDATSSAKGVVKIGSNIDVANSVISVKEATTAQKGVTQLSSSEDNESETLAATVKLANSKVKSVTAEKGLTSSTSNHEVTVKANLLSETPLTNASAAATETEGRVYPVALDKDGKLAANIPWTDTTYEPATKTADGLMEAGDKLLLEKHSKELSDIWEIVQQSDTAVYKTVTGNPVIISDGYDGGVIKSLIVTLPDNGTTVESVTIKRYAVKRTDDDSTQTVTATADASTGELTPSEDVTTLLGENVIYAESGNTSLPLTLSYRVDLVYMQHDSYTAKTASGNPVSISDGAENIPVKDLTVELAPVQSGEGDPYPPGGGKNLIPFPYSWGGSGESYATNGVRVTINADGSLTLNGTASAQIWTGGGILNKTPIENTLFRPGESYIVSGGYYDSNTNFCGIYFNTYDADGNMIQNGSGPSNAGQSVLVTIPENCETVAIALRVTNGATLNNYVLYPMIRSMPESGSSASEYAPYSNIRPVAGFDSVTVRRRSVNILPLLPEYFTNTNGQNLSKPAGTMVVSAQETADGTVYTLTSKTQTGIRVIVTPARGTVRIVGRPSSARVDFLLINNQYCPSDFYNRYLGGRKIAFIPNVISGSTSTSTAGFGAYTDSGINMKAYTSSVVQFPDSANTWNINFGVFVSSADYDVTFRPMLVEVDSADADLSGYDWSPYADEQAVTISTGDAGTVYGGTLDVTTGLLTVTRKYLRLNGSEEWVLNTNAPSGLAWFYLSESVPAFPIKSDNYIAGTVMCSTYPVIASTAPWNNAQNAIIPVYRSANGKYELCVTDTRFDSAAALADWKANLAANPVEIVYPLETPLTYQLTPAEVTTLLGDNIISSDAGSISVTYRADPSLAYQNLETTVTNAILSLGMGI